MERLCRVSQVAYQVPAGIITRVNGCCNDGATTYKFNFTKGNKMSRNTSQKAAEQVGGLFNLVLISSIRVRELKSGHKPKVVDAGGITATALKEIEDGHIGIEYLKKVAKQKSH